MSKTVIIRNVEFHYAHVFKSHAPFGQEIWDVQIRTTDPTTIQQLEEAGVKMKQHPEGYAHANVKRKVLTSKGEKNKPVVVVDGAKQPISEDTMIGNGSKGHIKLFSYDWSMQGRSGTSALLSAMQITDLKIYEGSGNVDFEIEAGEAADF